MFLEALYWSPPDWKGLNVMYIGKGGIFTVAGKE